MFGAIGLSATAEAVYLAMLSAPELDVPQLAQQLGEPVEVIREALDELLDLALITRAGSGARVRPIGPTVGLASLIAQAEADVAERQQQLAATRAAVASLAAAHQAASDREHITTWTGTEAVRARIEELSAATELEVVSLNPNAAQTPDAKRASRPVNEDLLARGVALRFVYQDSHRLDPALLAYSTWLTNAGGELRTAPTVPMLMIIYDRRVALLPIDPADNSLGAQEVRSPGLVAATYGLFEQVWSTARPVGDRATRDGQHLDAQLRELARLLAVGSTDEMAARKLGVSERTIKRKSAELMELLNARSRFQAGVHAAQRGWVDVPTERSQRAEAAFGLSPRTPEGPNADLERRGGI